MTSIALALSEGANVPARRIGAVFGVLAVVLAS